MKMIFMALIVVMACAGNIPRAHADDGDTPAATVAERMDCAQLKSQIDALDAMAELDDADASRLENFRMRYRRDCSKKSASRAGHTIAGIRAPSARTFTPTARGADASGDDNGCDAPDEYGCCPGESLMDMGADGFYCCQTDGDMCFPANVTVATDMTVAATVNATDTVTDVDLSQCDKLKALIDETRQNGETSLFDALQQDYERECLGNDDAANADNETDAAAVAAENRARGLCGDGAKPNKFGCCDGEIFKDVGNLVFKCCNRETDECNDPLVKE